MARITDSEAVALYDSTSMQAFGPIFESEAHAEDFLRWLGEKPRPWLPTLPPKGGRWVDPTAYSASALNVVHDEWRRQRCDDDGYLKAGAS